MYNIQKIVDKNLIIDPDTLKPAVWTLDKAQIQLWWLNCCSGEVSREWEIIECV